MNAYLAEIRIGNTSNEVLIIANTKETAKDQLENTLILSNYNWEVVWIKQAVVLNRNPAIYWI